MSLLNLTRICAFCFALCTVVANARLLEYVHGGAQATPIIVIGCAAVACFFLALGFFSDLFDEES